MKDYDNQVASINFFFYRQMALNSELYPGISSWTATVLYVVWILCKDFWIPFLFFEAPQTTVSWLTCCLESGPVLIWLTASDKKDEDISIGLAYSYASEQYKHEFVCHELVLYVPTFRASQRVTLVARGSTDWIKVYWIRTLKTTVFYRLKIVTLNYSNSPVSVNSCGNLYYQQ